MLHFNQLYSIITKRFQPNQSKTTLKMYSATFHHGTNFENFSTTGTFKRTVKTETLVIKRLITVVNFFEKLLGWIGKATILLIFCLLVPFIIMPILWMALWFSARHMKKRTDKIIEVLPFMKHADIIDTHLLIERHLKQLAELKVSTLEFSNALSSTLFQPFLNQIIKYHTILANSEQTIFKAAYPEYDIEHSEDELRLLAEAYKHVDLKDID